ncbi:hypothetical protein EYF80_064708 [Liparis tanakae]|uniref:Uncharacterized protein n=1 Tax=Liparis tanakae TaxID=230148 RepID=A0A4Z2E9G7_9TELE|nr:hypothetical protein EYF80_064708 [Liparis tanakae]
MLLLPRIGLDACTVKGLVFLPCTGSEVQCRTRTHDSSVSLQHPVRELASFPCIFAAQRWNDVMTRVKPK